MKNLLKQSILICFTVLLSNSIANAQTLDSLMKMTVANNPSLKALELEYRAELAALDQVSQLQQPQVGVGIPILRPETRLGPQLMMVSASQMFPWFGTGNAKKEVVLAMSKIQFEKIAALKLNLFYTLKSNYYQLIYCTMVQELIKDEIRLLKTLEQLSLSKVESGEGSIAAVLRVQLAMEELATKIDLLENDKINLNAGINSVIKSNFNQQITSHNSALEIPLLAFDLETLQTKIASHHPLMVMLNAEIETSQKRTHLNNSVNNPTISLGLDYNLVGERTDADPENNGRDILVPKLMVSIPIYRKSFRAKNEMEAYKQEVLELDKISLIDQITTQLIEYKTAYDNALLLHRLSEKQEKTAAQTYEILLTNYTNNNSGFDDLLAVHTQLLNYKKQGLKARLDANIALAKIERLTQF